jgi:hypothetical protein
MNERLFDTSPLYQSISYLPESVHEKVAFYGRALQKVQIKISRMKEGDNNTLVAKYYSGDRCRVNNESS